MRVVIDRIEDGIASVELPDGKLINVPAELFDGCKESDVVQITPDAEATEKRTREIRAKLKKMFDK